MQKECLDTFFDMCYNRTKRKDWGGYYGNTHQANIGAEARYDTEI